MKLRHLILFLFCLSITYGQQTPDAFMFAPGAQTQEIIPQSPEAGSLGRYGSIPISSATGQMSYSIPFYTIEVDGHSWPVGLNYNYGGLILEGKPSLMGLGWNLQAGAAVTREVRGLADEHNQGYNSTIQAPTESISGRTVRELINDYAYLEFNDEDPNNSGLDTWTMETLRKFRDGFYDAEPDKYTVNIGGTPFSFKINLDLPQDEQVYFLSKHSNKVEVLWSDFPYDKTDSNNYYITGFIITDTNGIKYRLDKEETSVPQGRGDDGILFLNPITAWKISEITYLNGQKITFNYTQNTIFDYNFRVAASAILSNVAGGSPNPNGYEPLPINQGNAIYTNPQYGDEITVGEINRNVLESIDFPKGSIEFFFNTSTNLYNSIELFDKNTPTPNSIKEFSFSHSGNRDLLNGINFNGEIYYQFEYHNELAIPQFIGSVLDKPLARKQDFWKFYNGASNDFALNVPNSQVNGVNRNPSFIHSRLGALKRIIYPTKGSTNIYYEQNQIESDFEIDDDYLRSLPAGELIDLSLDAQIDAVTQKTKTIEILHPTVAVVSHYINGDRDGYGIDLSLTRTDGESNYPIILDNVSVPPYPGANDFYYDVAPYLKQKLVEYDAPYTIPPMYPNFVEQFGYADTDSNGEGLTNITISETTTDKILIMPGTYEMNIQVGSLGANVRGSISIQTFGDLNQPLPDRINKAVGGIRVDYMKDCSDSFDANCFITDYDYNDEDGFSNGVQYLIPQLKTFYTLDHLNLPGENTIPGVYYRTQIVTFTENPFTVNDPLLGTPVFYEKIISTKRQSGSIQSVLNAEIGKIETKYSLPMENRANFFPRYPTGADLDKSLPVETYSFEKDKGESVSLGKKTYFPTRGLLSVSNGQDVDDRHPWGLKVHINSYRNIDHSDNDYNVLNPDLGTSADLKLKALHGVKAYRELDTWDRLVSTFNEVDGLSAGVTYKYNTDYNLIEEESTDSRGNTLLKEIKYAKEALLNGMIDINQISTPVEVKSYYNDKLQSTQLTEFELVQNGYKPSKVLASKSNYGLETKMQFAYNSLGKIQQVDQLLDSPDRPGDGNEKILKSTAYVWGYSNEYPVAKVDNATYSQVIGSGANMTTLRSNSASLTNKQIQFQNLRNSLPDAFVSGYVYEPLVGVSNMIDSRGYTTNYQYDFRNRLLNIKDEANKMLQEYAYEYRSENYTNPDNVDQYPDLGGSINGIEEIDFGGTSTFVANATGGSDDFSYTWYLNDVFLTSNVNELEVTFDAYGDSILRVEIIDNITGEDISLTKTVTVNNDLGTVSLNATPDFGFIGDIFTITSSGINEGSGSLSYQWIIDDGAPEVYTGETNFQTSFSTIGQHEVKLIVTDNVTNDFIEGTISITILEPLPTLNLSASTSLVLPNTAVIFTPTNLSNTHGFIDIVWTVNGPNGIETLSYKGDEPYDIAFDTPGEYEVIFAVNGLSINQFEQASATITVSDGLAVGNIGPSEIHIKVGDPVTFLEPIIDGSGDYTYSWKVDNTEESNIEGDFTFNNFNSQDDYYVKLEVFDNILGQTRTSANVRVRVWNPIAVPTTIGSSRDPIYMNQSVIFSALSSGGGSGDNTRFWHIKYENNAETFEGNTTNLTKTLTSIGTYTVRLRIVDNLISNHEVEVNESFEVYTSLNVGALTINPSKIIRGTSLTFTAPSVSGGSDNKNYQWLVNGVQRSTSQENFTYNQFNTAGDYDVTYRVTDNTLNISEDRTVNINVYNPLNTPSFGQPVSHIEVGEDLYMATSNNGGGSGSRNYKWYVKLNSGSYTQISGANATTLTYDSFSSVGTYTIRFRVTDNNVPTHFKEVTKVVNVYAPIQISNSDITTPSPVDVNTDTYFNINSAGGGSGNFEYRWSVINTVSNFTTNLGPFTGANKNVASFNMPIDFVGTARIQCRIKDLVTNKEKVVFKNITVNGFGPLTAPLVLFFDTDTDPESASFRLTASASGGSGQDNFNFRWIVDGVVVQETGSNIYEYVTLTCSKQTAVVQCVVIDTVTGVQAGPRTIPLNLGFNCGGQ